MIRFWSFAAAQAGRIPAYEEAITALGAEIARRGMSLVFGGGHVGLMGVVADAVLSGGGEVVGVIPGALMQRELGHGRVTRLEVVDSMHARKARMAELSDGFLALPGGIGTMEELFEIWTWTQIGVHGKPCGILNVDGYYDGLLSFLDGMVDRGFLAQSHRDVVLVDDDPASLIARVVAHRPQIHERWMDSTKT